jgi:hypothetical protein
MRMGLIPRRERRATMQTRIVVAVLAVILLAAVILTATGGKPPSCFEDEVVMWDGDGHTLCVPLDDLTGG